jgi:hypothetical protein
VNIKRFEDLEIWKEARELCKVVQEITSQAPFWNDFKLRDQIRGSSGSAMDNIAEEKFNELLERTDSLSRKTYNLMKHLKNSDIKGLKYF